MYEPNRFLIGLSGIITMVVWVWQQADWPKFHWQEAIIQPLLRAVRHKQGILFGKTGAINPSINLESCLNTLIDNIIASSAIEGEQLNAQSIRSSLAKRLGLQLKQPYSTSKRSEGLAKIMLDAMNKEREQNNFPFSLNKV